MINEINNINLNDNVVFTILDHAAIREEDEYGGYRVFLEAKMENIRERFHLDIATGDPITPKEITYNYKTLLANHDIKVWAYNIETVLAEKLETILSRNEFNGRMKDFYDVYLIYTMKWNSVNIDHLRKAVQVTFAKRNYFDDMLLKMNTIRNSTVIKEKWEHYLRKNRHIEFVSFEEIVACLLIIVQQLDVIYE